MLRLAFSMALEPEMPLLTPAMDEEYDYPHSAVSDLEGGPSHNSRGHAVSQELQDIQRRC